MSDLDDLEDYESLIREEAGEEIGGEGEEEDGEDEVDEEEEGDEEEGEFGEHADDGFSGVGSEGDASGHEPDAESWSGTALLDQFMRTSDASMRSMFAALRPRIDHTAAPEDYLNSAKVEDGIAEWESPSPALVARIMESRLLERRGPQRGLSAASFISQQQAAQLAYLSREYDGLHADGTKRGKKLLDLRERESQAARDSATMLSVTEEEFVHQRLRNKLHRGNLALAVATAEIHKGVSLLASAAQTLDNRLKQQESALMEDVLWQAFFLRLQEDSAGVLTARCISDPSEKAAVCAQFDAGVRMRLDAESTPQERSAGVNEVNIMYEVRRVTALRYRPGGAPTLSAAMRLDNAKNRPSKTVAGKSIRVGKLVRPAALKETVLSLLPRPKLVLAQGVRDGQLSSSQGSLKRQVASAPDPIGRVLPDWARRMPNFAPHSPLDSGCIKWLRSSDYTSHISEKIYFCCEEFLAMRSPSERSDMLREALGSELGSINSTRDFDGYIETRQIHRPKQRLRFLQFSEPATSGGDGSDQSATTVHFAEASVSDLLLSAQARKTMQGWAPRDLTSLEQIYGEHRPDQALLHQLYLVVADSTTQKDGTKSRIARPLSNAEISELLGCYLLRSADHIPNAVSILPDVLRLIQKGSNSQHAKFRTLFSVVYAGDGRSGPQNMVPWAFVELRTPLRASTEVSVPASAPLPRVCCSAPGCPQRAEVVFGSLPSPLCAFHLSQAQTIGRRQAAARQIDPRRNQPVKRKGSAVPPKGTNPVAIDPDALAEHAPQVTLSSDISWNLVTERSTTLAQMKPRRRGQTTSRLRKAIQDDMTLNLGN